MKDKENVYLLSNCYVPGTRFCEAGAKYLHFTDEKMEALRGWAIYIWTPPGEWRGLTWEPGLCASKGSYLAGRRSGSHPQGSRIKIPWQCRGPGSVSHMCRACSIKSCFPVPHTYLPSLILSCDHFPLRECLLIVWVLPSFLPLHSHKPCAHPCTALLLLWGNASALCILSGKKITHVFQKYGTNN